MQRWQCPIYNGSLEILNLIENASYKQEMRKSLSQRNRKFRLTWISNSYLIRPSFQGHCYLCMEGTFQLCLKHLISVDVKPINELFTPVRDIYSCAETVKLLQRLDRLGLVGLDWAWLDWAWLAWLVLAWLGLAPLRFT